MAQDDKDKKRNDERPKGRPEPDDAANADTPASQPPPVPPGQSEPGGGQSHDPRDGEGGGE